MGTEQEYPVMVTIRCFVYNHESYLRQCLDGFVMQKTNFPFEAIVHDDASTDKTAAIIREYAEKYPNIIKPIYETENQYSKHDGSLHRIMDAHTRGKYIAYCEGDDYWIDPLKLQKQVDFLEKNIDYALVYTNYKNFYVDKNVLISAPHPNRESGNIFDKLLQRNFIVTATVLVRSEILQEAYRALNMYSQKWLMKDYPLWLEIARQWKIKYLVDITTVYRILAESASHSVNVDKMITFEKSVLSIQIFFASLNKAEYLVPRIEEEHCANIYLLSLLNNSKSIEMCRKNMQNCHVTTRKNKLLKCASKYSSFEYVFKYLLNHSFVRKAYSKLLKNGLG